MWRETTLLTDKAVQFAIAKTYVFSDSVLCLGGINGCRTHAVSENWIGSMENRWNSSGQYSPGFTTLGILDETQKMMTESKCEPEHFPGRITSMSMYNDVAW